MNPLSKAEFLAGQSVAGVLDGGGAAEAPVVPPASALRFSSWLMAFLGPVRPAASRPSVAHSPVLASSTGDAPRLSRGARLNRGGEPGREAGRGGLAPLAGRGPQAPRPRFISRTLWNIYPSTPGELLESKNAKCHHIATAGHHCTIARWAEVRVRGLRSESGRFPQCFDCGGPSGLSGRPQAAFAAPGSPVPAAGRGELYPCASLASLGPVFVAWRGGCATRVDGSQALSKTARWFWGAVSVWCEKASLLRLPAEVARMSRQGWLTEFALSKGGGHA